MSEGDGRSRAADAAALIVGAGPAGLMLAAELALARVDVVVERRDSQTLAGARRGPARTHDRDPRSARGAKS